MEGNTIKPFKLSDKQVLYRLSRSAKWEVYGYVRTKTEKEFLDAVADLFRTLYMESRGFKKSSELSEDDISERETILKRIWGELSGMARQQYRETKSQRDNEENRTSVINQAFSSAGFIAISVNCRDSSAVVIVAINKYEIRVIVKYADIDNGNLNNIVDSLLEFSRALNEFPHTIRISR